MEIDRDYTSYALRRDANTIAKFIGRMTSHREKLALYKIDPKIHAFPRPLGKDSKWPAYEAASRIERALGLGTRASSVPELAEVLSKALVTAL